MDCDLLSCQIKYDGPALQDHTIDVNKLAPALLSFSEAMTKISNHVDPQKSAVCNVKIKAFKEGCFISDLIIESVQQNPEDFAGVLGTVLGQVSSNVEVLYKILVDVVNAKLFKKKHEEANVKIQLNIDNSVTYNVSGEGNVVAGDNSKITISRAAHEILEEKKLDPQLKDIVAPLSQEKIDSLHVTSMVGKDKKIPLGFDIREEEKEYFYGESEIKIMEVKVKGYIENMHKKYRTFGLVDKNSKYACYIPKDESLDKYNLLFTESYVEIEGEAEVNQDNVIQKIKVKGGRKLQSDIFDELNKKPDSDNI